MEEMKFYSLDSDLVFNEMLADELEQPLNDSNNKKFPLIVINNLPFIDFPAFTKEQNQTIYKISREVLMLSKLKNEYNEVSITYRVDKPVEDKDSYITVFGTEESVLFLEDPKIPPLLARTNDLLIINTHNHPNDTGFSLKDLLMFTQYENIRLVEIVNTKGQVSFLYKPEKILLNGIIRDAVYLHIPDIITRSKFEKANAINENREMKSIFDLMTQDEKNKIVNTAITILQEKGICYCDYVDKTGIIKYEFPSINNSDDINEKNKKEVNGHGK